MHFIAHITGRLYMEIKIVCFFINRNFLITAKTVYLKDTSIDLK